MASDKTMHSVGGMMGRRDVRLAIGAYVLLLVILPLAMEPDRFWALVSEAGPYERLSVAAWLVVAAVVLVHVRPLGGRALAFALLFVLFAAREADWHKAFTADSLLKTNYYRKVPAPLMEKLIAAAVALLFIGLLLYAAVAMLRWLRHRDSRRSEAGRWLMLGLGLLVLGKFIDRLPSMLEESLGIGLLPWLNRLRASFEEGLELLSPVLIGLAIWIGQKEGALLKGRKTRS